MKEELHNPHPHLPNEYVTYYITVRYATCRTNYKPAFHFRFLLIYFEYSFSRSRSEKLFHFVFRRSVRHELKENLRPDSFYLHSTLDIMDNCSTFQFQRCSNALNPFQLSFRFCYKRRRQFSMSNKRVRPIDR